jgi:hypothetical protein
MASKFFKARKVSDTASARDSQLDVAREIASKSLPNSRIYAEELAKARAEGWTRPNGRQHPRD